MQLLVNKDFFHELLFQELLLSILGEISEEKCQRGGHYKDNTNSNISWWSNEADC